MACRGRRLGQVLTDTAADAVAAAVLSVGNSRHLLIDLVRTLTETPAPNGAEQPAALALMQWGCKELADLRFSVDCFDDARANLFAEGGTATGPDFGMYAHLDTSLTADLERDVAITGRSDPVPSLRVDGDELVALGLAVARASVAAAMIGLHGATKALDATGVDYRLRLLLAAGGTHRWPVISDGPTRFGVGARRALAAGFRPEALLNVKAGAPAPMHEEPGAAYFTIVVIGSWEPVLFRSQSPGTLAILAPLLAVVERWRAALVARPVPPGSTSGREAALGAVSAGAIDKPDLLPARILARVFVVLAPGDDPIALAMELQAEIESSLRSAELGGVRTTVTADVFDGAGRSDPESLVATLVRSAWTDRFGPPPDVSGWRGSTDGVVFRNAGIETIRVGPSVANDVDDPRLDRVSVAELLSFAGLYAEVAVRWVLAQTDRRTA